MRPTTRTRVTQCLLALALVTATLGLHPQPAAAATDWRSGPWYGWIEWRTTGETTGPDVSAHGRDETYRIRVLGSTARVIAASGSSWNEAIGACDFTTHTILGPGTPIPFGNQFEVLGHPSSPMHYSLGPSMMSARVEQARTDCAPTQQVVEDSAVGFDVGCGPFDWETGRVGPCVATDTNHLKGSADVVDTFSHGSYRTVATWDLTRDPAADPCLTLADRCLEKPDAALVVANTGAGGALGAACGRATFGWRHVTLTRTSVDPRERVCVFLVGNKASRQILSVAANQGVDIGSAFAGTILRQGVIKLTPDVAQWAAAQAAEHVLLRQLGKAVGANAARFTPIVSIGTAVGLLAVPLAAGIVAGQITRNNACIQVITDMDSGRLKLDWSMVYARSSDARLTRAKVYRKIDRRFRPDIASPAYLQMSCSPNGSVKVSSTTSSAMASKRTTLLRLP